MLAGLLSLVSVPMGIELKEWFGEFGASSWVPLYIFGTAFVLLVMYGLIRAPRDLYVEALAEVGQLRLTIEDKERIQRALNELWALRKEGVELRNKHVRVGEFDTWKAEYDDWQEKVDKSARQIRELGAMDQDTRSNNPRDGSASKCSHSRP
jgi:hypothetical protein